MGIQEQLQADIKEAMRAGDTLRRDTLRMVVAAFKNRRIELGADLNEEQALAVLAYAVKTRKDSAEQYEKGGRPELVEKELAEIAVIEDYLPKGLSDEETETIVVAKIAELGITSKKEVGKLMKALMAEYKGRIDGKVVQRLVGERLEA